MYINIQTSPLLSPNNYLLNKKQQNNTNINEEINNNLIGKSKRQFSVIGRKSKEMEEDSFTKNGWNRRRRANTLTQKQVG